MFEIMSYLPEIGFWKTPSSNPNTGQGRLEVAGRNNSTVMDELGASITHMAGVRPGVQHGSITKEFIVEVRLEVIIVSGTELFRKRSYLPAVGFWKTPFPDSNTGPGRLQVDGRRGSTVMRGSGASKKLAASERPGFG